MKRLLLLLLIPLPAYAQPVSVSYYLTNEPASLFDIGLLWTRNGQLEAFDANPSASYDADDDKIYVSLLVMNSDATEAQMAEGCEMALEQLGIWLWKFTNRLFSHVGQEESLNSLNLDGSVSDLFVMRCYVSSATDTSEGRFWASRRLTEEELKIGEW